jgi:hypothetical protein
LVGEGWVGRVNRPAEEEVPVADGALVLEIPADAAQLSTVRLFAGGVGRHFGMDEETVEDLKLAVSEAVALATTSGVPGGRATILAVPTDDGTLSVEVRWDRDGVGGTWTPAGPDGVMSLGVLGGLFEDLSILDGEPGSLGLRFSLHHGSQAGRDGAAQHGGTFVDSSSPNGGAPVEDRGGPRIGP